jgi:hypothetical protein
MTEHLEEYTPVAATQYGIHDEGHGFYSVTDPQGNQVGSCEGFATARQLAVEHQAKVAAFYRRNCDLAPLQLQAARSLSIRQAARIVEDTHNG